MPDTYHIIDGQVVPYSGGRKCNNTDAWRDATQLELQLQEKLVESQQLIAAQAAEIEALRAEVDALREVLEERDADLKRLAFLSNEPVIEGFVGIPKDVYDYAFDCAEECGRDEPNDEDMLNGMRRLIDAAIAAANGGRDE